MLPRLRLWNHLKKHQSLRVIREFSPDVTALRKKELAKLFERQGASGKRTILAFVELS